MKVLTRTSSREENPDAAIRFNESQFRRLFFLS
jgi:hypothetical protein